MPDHDAPDGDREAMTANRDALDERLRAVERALTDADDLTDLRDAADLARELETFAERLDDAEARLDDLDAATQALRGYVGNVRAVNQSVERTADAALAKAEELAAEVPETTAPKTERSDLGYRPPSTRSCECPTCACGARRPDESKRTCGQNASGDETDAPGLLGRAASWLASALTATDTEGR